MTSSNVPEQPSLLIHEPEFYSDAAVPPGGEDLLQRRPFATRLAKAIIQRTGKESYVIALNGPWGSGKSTVKNFVLETLAASEKPPYVVEFLPWLWRDQEQLTMAFFYEIGKELERLDEEKITGNQERSNRWKEYGALFALGGNAMKHTGTVVSLTGNTALGELIKNTGEKVADAGKSMTDAGAAAAARADASKKSVKELRDSLRADMEALDRPILVVIDDVDRLTKPEIAAVMQLVKANGNFPNVIYMLLFDRQAVEAALQSVAPDGVEKAGRAYLEKIVQVSFDVPANDRKVLRKVLETGMRQALNKEEKWLDTPRWETLYLKGLTPYFSTIRNVRRFLNSFSFMVGMFFVGDDLEINAIDLAALEILRIFEPQVWEKLSRRRELITDSDVRVRMISEEDIEAARKSAASLWESALNMEEARIILTDTFPTIQWIRDAKRAEDRTWTDLIFGVRDSAVAVALRERRVWLPKLFDYYFQLTPPEDHFSVARSNEIMTATRDRTLLNAQFDKLADEELFDVGLEQIVVRANEIPDENVETVATSLLDSDRHQKYPLPMGSESTTVANLTEELVTDLLTREKDFAKRGAICVRVISATSGLALPVFVVNELTSTLRGRIPELLDSDAKAVQQLCVQKIRIAAHDGSLLKHPSRGHLLFRWLDWGGAEEPSQWTLDTIQTDEGLLDFLVGFLNTSYGGPLDDEATARYFLETNYVARFVPLDVVRQRVASISGALNALQQAAVDALRYETPDELSDVSNEEFEVETIIPDSVSAHPTDSNQEP